MYNSIDGDQASIGPSLNNNYLISLYYVVFIWIGTFFFLNLFVGAICYHFDKSQSKFKLGQIMLTDDQIRWIDT